MGVFQNAFFFAGTLYGLLYERTLVLYFLAFVGAYFLLYTLTPSGKYNPLRRRLMFASWERPAEGNIHLRCEQNCTNVLKYLQSFKKEERPSVTHVAVKAMAELLNKSRTTLNGKIVFDKFVPFDTVAVTVLVDIGGGQDLAAVTIDKCDELSIKDLSDYIKARGKKIKDNKGDAEHKQKTQSIQFLPPFLIKLSLKIVQWLSFNLGLNVKPLAVKRNAFGGGTVTSLGMLGVKDAFVPFTPFMNCPIILAVGQIEDKAVVIDGKIEVAPMINLNVTIDHRFIDGAKGKSLIQAVDDVFQNPEKY